jgi:hypothetical protein
MSKVLALQNIEKRLLAAEMRTVAMEADDLNAELRDVKTVVEVAMETLTEEGESAVAIGALKMIEHKLNLIKRSALNIQTVCPIKPKGR